MTVTITLPPSPAPQRADPVNFSARADAYHAWLVPAVSQMNSQNIENNSINNGLPAAAAAAVAAAIISATTTAVTITNWNSVSTQGYFMGNGAIEAPEPTGWFLGYVISHSTEWVTQEVWKFMENTETQDTKRYRRERNNGTWQAWIRIYSTAEEIALLVAAKAAINQPAFTGIPTAPTASANTNTTQIATTAYVLAERNNTATLTNKTLTSPTINSPTGIVKADVGLGNVDNTSDANKPVSTATQTALNAKVTGPSSATDNALVRFDGTTGKLVQSSGVVVDDSGNLTAGFGTFTNEVSASVLRSSGTYPFQELRDTGGPTDKKNWRWSLSSGTYRLENVNDAYNAILMTPISIDSSGNATFSGNVNTPRATATTGVAISGDTTDFSTGSGSVPNYGIGYLTGTNETVISGFGGVSLYTNQSLRFSVDISGNATFSGDLTLGNRLFANSFARIKPDSNGYSLFIPAYGTNEFDTNFDRFEIRTDTTPGGDIFIGGVHAGSAAPRGLSFIVANQTSLAISSSRMATFLNSTGFGYGSGSGGSVTQPTDKSTTVTINKPSMLITTSSAGLAAGASIGFQVNNSTVGLTDQVVSTFVGTLASVHVNYSVRVAVGNGAFFVHLTNHSGGTLSEAVPIKFDVIKGSTT